LSSANNESKSDLSVHQLQQSLKNIEEELKKPVDAPTFHRLFKELQKAQNACETIQSKSLFGASFLSDSEDRIRSLFGKVMNTHVDTEVNEILSISHLLQIENKPQALALKKRILTFREWQRPSKDNLLKLLEAEKQIDRVLGKISSKFVLPAPSEDLIEEVESLFKLASLVYHKKQEERNKTYLLLSKEAKERFSWHLICLKTTAFEKPTATIKALFASAFDLAGVPRDTYVSSKEIKKFFAEEDLIVQEEKKTLRSD
jgi:hypothetical protein